MTLAAGIYVIEGVNPEPWTPGTIGHKAGRSFMYKDSKLNAFQKALADELKKLYPKAKPVDGIFTLNMWFWRSTEGGQPADRTNLQKATEDAIQKVLIGNDRNSQSGYTEIVEQGPTVEPKIIIEVRPFVAVPPPAAHTPQEVFLMDVEERSRRENYEPTDDF